MTKILTPAQPAPVMQIARQLMPPGMELLVVDPAKPEFYDAAADAEYYLGSPRFGIGNEFFRAAPKLKLVQLTSAGYDRVDLEAARKARVPVANNGGANSVAVAEHAVMLERTLTICTPMSIASSPGAEWPGVMISRLPRGHNRCDAAGALAMSTRCCLSSPAVTLRENAQ